MCRLLTAVASLVAAKGSRAWAQRAVRRFNRPAACEVFADRESNPHFLHRQATAFPLSHVHSSPSTHCEVNPGPLAFAGARSGHADPHGCLVLGVLPVQHQLVSLLRSKFHRTFSALHQAQDHRSPGHLLRAALKEDCHFCSGRATPEIVLSVFLSTCPLLILSL